MLIASPPIVLVYMSSYYDGSMIHCYLFLVSHEYEYGCFLECGNGSKAGIGGSTLVLDKRCDNLSLSKQLWPSYCIAILRPNYAHEASVLEKARFHNNHSQHLHAFSLSFSPPFYY
jgi:hypothetical protein